MGISELHSMSINNLKQVTQVQHLALDFDGEFFSITTQMLHSDVFNRHRVLWVPGAVFRTWQWKWQLGLVQHRAVLTLHRQHLRPKLAEFSARPVVFNPDHANAGVRRTDYFAQRVIDGMRTKFGDSFEALFYSPIVKNVQRVLNSLDTLTLVKQFVCYAAGHH
ncbi:uncharacterized protein LOC108680876 isoform X2 [Hyalella azteca]|uniref:Uncharacterized protein LOC108680876 isoform X2 n=1 Tax=Hyalella azteca TaxID=294128 RepID=A0A8B7PH05_HYAAZ|nr:uncharacterized protein LOC108680876 isoform X2 [Hyalella azteca]